MWLRTIGSKELPGFPARSQRGEEHRSFGKGAGGLFEPAGQEESRDGAAPIPKVLRPAIAVLELFSPVTNLPEFHPEDLAIQFAFLQKIPFAGLEFP
jgi:hypothetical protein